MSKKAMVKIELTEKQKKFVGAFKFIDNLINEGLDDIDLLTVNMLTCNLAEKMADIVSKTSKPEVKETIIPESCKGCQNLPLKHGSRYCRIGIILNAEKRSCCHYKSGKTQLINNI